MNPEGFRYKAIESARDRTRGMADTRNHLGPRTRAERERELREEESRHEGNSLGYDRGEHSPFT